MRGEPRKRRFVRYWRRWRQLTAAERRALIVATGYLLSAYLSFRRRPVALLLTELRNGKAANAMLTPARPSFDPFAAAHAVAVASRAVPWRSDCLIKAIAVTRWLRRHGREPEFHLGVKSSGGETREIEAHAWLTLDGRFLIGDDIGNLDAFASILRSDHSADGCREV